MKTLWGATTWLKVDESGAWYTRRTKAGPATIRMVHQGDVVAAEAWGPGAQLLLDSVPDLLGLNAAGIEDVTPHHPVVYDLIRKMRGYRQACSGDVYPRLISAAIAQKVAGVNAKPALRNIAWKWGEPAPGPREDLRLLPEPRVLASIPYFRFHALGVEKHRADLIIRIAERARAMQRAANMTHEEGRIQLERLRGIGPWTSGVVMGGPLGDPDAVPLADWHLPNIVSYSLAGEPRGTDERMMELLEPYKPYRGMVARGLKAVGHHAPKWGPKTSTADIPD